MDLKQKLLSLLLCAAVTLSLLPVSALAAENAVTVTIFTTNDVHGAVENSDTAIGLVQAAAIKASTPNALLVDAGDATNGLSFATVSQGEGVIQLMNAAGYDAMAAGNHEFDYGTERLLSNAEAADFPIMSANVKKDGKSLLPGSTVVEVGGKTIGFIGITTAHTAVSVNPAKLTGVEFGSEIAAAKEQIKALADETDAVIIICHLGNVEEDSDCTSAVLLDALSNEELAEVAAVVDGHSHTVEQDPYERNGVSIPIIQTGTHFTALGKIELTFADGTFSAKGTLLDHAAAMGYTLTDAGKAAAAKVQTALDEINAAQSEILDMILCENKIPLWGGYIYWDFAEPRVVETSYGDLVTDAFAASTKMFAEQNKIDLPVVAVTNGGGISATLPMGKVTRGDVLNAFNHGNVVEVLEVTPAQIYAALEEGLNTFTGQDDTGTLLFQKHNGSFMQVSGFTYSFDPAAAVGAKVTSATLADGTELSRADTDTKLLLSTNNYVGAYFSGIGARKLGEMGGEDQVIVDHILSLTEGGAALNYKSEPRISITGDKSPETYTVSIPVLSAEDGGTAIPGARVTLSTDGGKSKKYTTDKNGNITVTLTRGAHTLSIKECADGKPVYVNNYSGAGTVVTNEGNYRFGFLVNADGLSSDEPSSDESSSDDLSPDDSEQPNTDNPPTGDASEQTLLVAVFAAALVVSLRVKKIRA
ncbi:MAG: bifunctional metallophosphatase/5'-nucleotidase [Oscillospiraceae bacterium]|nr:bifunctional metallophosphatase/5'-nucleotidase [Oscillospiraceae bacterium]